jgi:TatD DNase family protein
MILIDTHTHLYLEEFANDADKVIAEAINNNIKYMILPNIDSTTINDMLKITDKYPSNCFPAIGLHPTSVKNNFEEELNIIEHTFIQSFTSNNTNKFVALGEIGIDLFWDKTFFEQQKEAFIRQIKFANKYNLPIIIHSRNSLNEILEIINKQALKLTGIFHCFPGDTAQAQILIEMGFKLGIGGVITYKNSTMSKVLADIPIQHIVLETDAPFLTPVPHRGKRNESKYINIIAKKVAEIKNITLEEVAKITTNNAKTLFPKIFYHLSV